MLYLVDRPEVGRAIERSAAKLGISDLIHVQRVAFGPGAGGISRGRTAERARAPSAGGGQRPTAGRGQGLTQAQAAAAERA